MTTGRLIAGSVGLKSAGRGMWPEMGFLASNTRILGREQVLVSCRILIKPPKWQDQRAGRAVLLGDIYISVWICLYVCLLSVLENRD